LAGCVVSRWALISGKVVALLCLIAALGYGVIYLTFPWLTSQRMSRVDPRLAFVPADLPTKAEVLLSDATIDCYGFSIRLPNEEVAKTFNGPFVTVVRFRNGGMLLIHNTSSNSGMLGVANSDKHVAGLIGQGAFQSKFSLMQAAMRTTPDDAKWWKFRTLENERVEYLLLTKFSVLTSIDSPHAFTLGPLYAISVGGLRGFQIGNPDVSPYEAHVDLFDATDLHLAFDVFGPKQHGQVITQAEMNSMVASVRLTAKLTGSRD